MQELRSMLHLDPPDFELHESDQSIVKVQAENGVLKVRGLVFVVEACLCF